MDEKQKGIIEKLGISKNWQPTENLGINKGICYETDNKEPENILGADIEGYYVFMKKEDRDLCLVAPETIKLIIDDVLDFEECIPNTSLAHKMYKTIQPKIDIIEKAFYPKSWAEIKELL